MASYNDYHTAFGMKRVASFEQLKTTQEAREKIKALYKDINNVEFLVGLWAETPSSGFLPGITGIYESMFGESINTMVGIDAFSQALTNPLLSENIYGEATFSKKGLEIIDSVDTLSQLMEKFADLKEKHISFRLS